MAITFFMFISMVSAPFRAMLSEAMYNFQAVAIKRGEAKRAVVTPIVRGIKALPCINLGLLAPGNLAE